jgi:hypothetical protein
MFSVSPAILRRMRLTRLFVSSLLAVLAACARSDLATVTIEYSAAGQRGEMSLEPSQKQRVSSAFTRVAKDLGYSCQPHRKRVEEIRCTGPKKMNIQFQPDLNESRYVATLNWLEIGDRSRSEFDAHVNEFVQGMRVATSDPSIAISVSNERLE